MFQTKRAKENEEGENGATRRKDEKRKAPGHSYIFLPSVATAMHRPTCEGGDNCPKKDKISYSHKYLTSYIYLCRCCLGTYIAIWRTITACSLVVLDRLWSYGKEKGG